jgi:hypothetical protein
MWAGSQIDIYNWSDRRTELFLSRQAGRQAGRMAGRMAGRADRQTGEISANTFLH